MQGLAKLTKLEAKVLFLRDPVVLLVALAVPIGIMLVCSWSRSRSGRRRWSPSA